MPDNVVDNLRVQVEAEAKKASAAIEGLEEQLGHLKNAVSSLKGLKIENLISAAAVKNIEGLSAAINNFNGKKLNKEARHINKFASSLAPLSQYSDSFSIFNSFSNGVNRLGAGMKSLSEVDVKPTIAKLEELSHALAPLTMYSDSILLFKELGSGIRNLGTGIKALNEVDITATVGKLQQLAAIDMTKLGVGLAPLASVAKALTAHENALAKSTSSATKEMSRQNREARNSHKSFSLASTAVGRFVSSVKRIAYYRAIRAVLKSFTTGLKEGIDNMYQWSAAVGSSFAPSMDKMATATQYLKNGFASMWSPLIEYAIPILDRVIDKLVDFFNFVQEGFAKLTGADHWTKALKVPKQYADVAADSAAGATKAAKELQNVLMGFDELNVINTPSDNGGGGSGSSGKEAEDYSSMFELVEVANQFKGIDWENLGKNIAQGINNFVKPINEFLTGKDFKEYGWNAASVIDGFFADIDANMLGETLMAAFTDAVDVFIGLLDGLADKHTGKKIGNAITEFIKGSLNWLTKWIQGTDFIKVLEDINTIVADVISGLDITAISNAIEDLIASIFFKLPGFIIKLTGDAILSPIENALRFVGFDDAADWISDTIHAPVDEVAKAIDEAMGQIQDSYNKYAETRDAVHAKEKAWNDDYRDAKDALDNLSQTMNVYSADGFVNETQRILDSFDGVKNAAGSTATFIQNTFEPRTNTALHKVRIGNNDAATSFTDFVDSVIDGSYTQIQNLDTLQEDYKNHTVKFSSLTDAVKLGYGNQSGASSTTTDSVVSNFKSVGDSMDELNRKYATVYNGITKEKYPEWSGASDLTAKEVEENNEEVSGSNELFKSKFTRFVAGLQNAFGSYVKTDEDGKLKIDKSNLISLNGYQAFLRGVTTTVALAKAAWDNWKPQPKEAVATVKTNYVNVYTNLEEWKANGGQVYGGHAGRYASGGFPDPGSFFWAGENGVPEILGTVNGRTAVAGGQEITGIADAIHAEGAEEKELLRTLISVLQAKDFSFTPNAASGKAINQALRQYAGVTG